mgnify:FL=1
MSSKAFYIATSSYDVNSRSLFVRELGGSGLVTAQELVSGVEDMQILYGIDNNASVNPDGEGNGYYRADQIIQDKADATAGIFITWDRVVSVRITLVMRSRNTPLNSDTTKTMPTLGTVFTDKYLYQEISTVIQIRNIALPGNPT